MRPRAFLVHRDALMLMVEATKLLLVGGPLLLYAVCSMVYLMVHTGVWCTAGTKSLKMLMRLGCHVPATSRCQDTPAPGSLIPQLLLVLSGILPYPKAWSNFTKGNMDIIMLVIIKPLAEQVSSCRCVVKKCTRHKHNGAPHANIEILV